jgi:hypothetical protein
MHQFTTYAITGLLIACLGIVAGCKSQPAVDAPTAASHEHTSGPGLMLAHSLMVFHAAKKRWPKDQAELSDFIAKSNGKLQPIKYDHLDFTNQPGGDLEVYAMSPGITNFLIFDSEFDHK